MLSGRKSIRLQMIWSFIASLILGMSVSTAIPTGLFFDIPLSMITFIGTFVVSFFFLTRHTIKYLRTLSDGLTVISGGNLHFRIPSTRQDELGKVAEHINAMAEKLESQIDKERQIEKSKMDLITGVSHDLRTPLTSIIGYIDLLKEKAYQDEVEHDRFIGNTYNKAMQLKTLIDDLFEYTRLAHNEAKLKFETIDLRELLNQMLVEFQPLAKDNEISMESSLPEHAVFIQVDPEQIRRAIDNLLMNALKFSVKPGVVRVSFAIRDDMATIMIENEGEAITKEQEKHLFERFYKIDDSRTNMPLYGGSGLGLSITKSIVELHGGQVFLKHSSGHFVFGIELPLTLK
ncbi:HAMP domain-containing histidine kinase [Cohnella sp. NL03-T5]|nr:HAMP domain-containing histidine kinase [Cohnella silvisoli]